jgi:phospholipase/lecithinase/hemolysin
MKHASQPSRLRRAAQIGIASAAFAVLVACGGGDGGSNNTSNASSAPAGGVNLQVVSFGTSLSDAGTYSPVIMANFGGGRFTTNPGEVWTQKVAEYYGGTLTPAYLGGFGQPLAASTGLDYAQGGSLVIGANGIGHAPATLPPYAQATTVPLVTQVQNYLSAHGSFNAGQLVLVEGGANDVLVAAQTAQLTIQAAVAQGTDVNTATVAAVTAQANTLVATAQQMVQQVIAPILAAGATHVLVANVPDIAVAPLGVASGPPGQQLFKTLVGAFNQSLAGTLSATGLMSKVIYLQTDVWIDNVVANYQANGFTVSNTGTACKLAEMQAAAQQFGESDPSAFASSLFCSPQLYTVAGADQSYMFADTIHPTTHLHALFAANAQQAIAATGLGK